MRPIAVALVVQIVLAVALLYTVVAWKPWARAPSSGDRRAPATVPFVPRAKVDRFDGDRAWRELLREVAMGPRPAGSSTLRRLAGQLQRKLPHAHQEAVGGGLFNVVGSLPGRGKAIVVAAHYDTKDIPGFVGANDGAGGTAALVEVAHAMAHVRRPAGAPPLRFVAFDGEESPADAPDEAEFYATGDRGSKAYVAAHAARTGRMILLDFVANRGLRLPREQGSNLGLFNRLRAAGRAVGVGAIFPDLERGEIVDDHTPFTRAGIPAIDLIDFDYPWWHTTGDTPDKLSKASLDAAGEAVVQLLRTLR